MGRSTGGIGRRPGGKRSCRQKVTSATSATAESLARARQLREVEAKLERFQAEAVELRIRADVEAKAETAELVSRLEAKLESHRKESEQQRRATEAKLERLQAEAVLTSKVASLQDRLEALHDAKLLDDQELSTIEDKVADAIGSGTEEKDESWECVMQMIMLSEGISSKKMFARQLRRKFVQG